jgi:TatD DNase family protein
VFTNAQKAGLEKIITVGTDDVDSRRALNFVTDDEIVKISRKIGLFATAGIHPHEASLGGDAFLSIKELVQNNDYKDVLVAIGECGLDYYKNFSSVEMQKAMLVWQIELALECDLPLVFHVRDAWSDFFEIMRDYPNIRGVIHSFTGGPDEVKAASKFDLYFGLNGIVTFTKEQKQIDAVLDMPIERILLETDCPFLTPVPMRGKQNQPSFVEYNAEFLAKLRDVGFEDLSIHTTQNAKALFGFKTRP